jgi:hypothetical protein
MSSINKQLTLASIIILAVSCLLVSETGCAQSTTPSPPNFTIQMPNNSTIKITIENQQFTNSNSVNAIVYFYQVKDHNAQNWLRYGSYYLQSSTDTTTITIPSVPDTQLFPSNIYSSILHNSTVLDFQLQALTGYYAVTNVSGAPAMISPAPQQWHTEITFNESAASEWSSTLTVDINQLALITPDSTYAAPEFPDVALLAVVLAAVSLLLVMGKRKVSLCCYAAHS